MDKLVSITWWRSIFVRYGQGLAVLLTIVMVVGFGWNQFGGGHNGGGAGPTAPDKVILKVNGEPVTQAQFARYASQVRGAKPGSEFAEAQGQALKGLIDATVVRQIAKQRNVHTTAAEVDQNIDQLRDRAGLKKSSDADWENFVQQKLGMSLSEMRDEVANDPSLLANALQQTAKTNIKVTDADVTNQNTQVKLDLVLIPYGTSQFMPAPKGKIPLTEPQAQQKAEDLYKQAIAGGNLAAIAKANSGDPSAAKGGDLDFRPEYKTMEGLGATFGAIGYGKDFDDAVHKTAVGQFTPVTKAAGFAQGYAFAKVVQRRVDTPKDFNPKKALDDMKTARAKQQVNDEMEAAFKSAKLDWQDPERKLYYDQNQLTVIPRQIMAARMSGNSASAPSQTDMAKQQEMVDAEWEAQLKQHPDDVNAALMVADAIKNRKRFARGATTAQNDAYRDRLISLYQLALKTTEDRDIRFTLADLLAEKKDYPAAGEQYKQIEKLMSYDPPYNLQTMQSYKTYYERLASAFTRIGQPEEAAKMQQAAEALQPKITQQQAIEQAQQQAQQRAQMQATMPPATTPGKPNVITVPAQSGSPTAPAGQTQPGTKR